MTISSCVKFKGGFAIPVDIEQGSQKELELAAHVATSLRKQGIEVGDAEDIEFAVSIPCKIGNRKYEVLASFDWVTKEWWEVFYPAPSIGLFIRLFRPEKVSAMQLEMQKLTRAIDKAVREIQGIMEVRWYPDFPSHPDKNWSRLPDLG